MVKAEINTQCSIYAEMNCAELLCISPLDLCKLCKLKLHWTRLFSGGGDLIAMKTGTNAYFQLYPTLKAEEWCKHLISFSARNRVWQVLMSCGWLLLLQGWWWWHSNHNDNQCHVSDTAALSFRTCLRNGSDNKMLVSTSWISAQGKK